MLIDLYVLKCSITSKRVCSSNRVVLRIHAWMLSHTISIVWSLLIYLYMSNLIFILSVYVHCVLHVYLCIWPHTQTHTHIIIVISMLYPCFSFSKLIVSPHIPCMYRIIPYSIFMAMLHRFKYLHINCP